MYKIKYLSLFMVQRSVLTINFTVTKNFCMEFRRYCFQNYSDYLDCPHLGNLFLFFIESRQFIFNIFIFLLRKGIPTSADVCPIIQKRIIYQIKFQLSFCFCLLSLELLVYLILKNITEVALPLTQTHHKMCKT